MTSSDKAAKITKMEELLDLGSGGSNKIVNQDKTDELSELLARLAIIDAQLSMLKTQKKELDRLYKQAVEPAVTMIKDLSEGDSEIYATIADKVLTDEEYRHPSIQTRRSSGYRIVDMETLTQEALQKGIDIFGLDDQYINRQLQSQIKKKNYKNLVLDPKKLNERFKELSAESVVPEDTMGIAVQRKDLTNALTEEQLEIGFEAEYREGTDEALEAFHNLTQTLQSLLDD